MSEYLSRAEEIHDSEDLYNWTAVHAYKDAAIYFLDEGYDDIAEDIFKLRKEIREALFKYDDQLKKLQPLLHAAWKYHELDWGKESFEEAIKTYREK